MKGRVGGREKDEEEEMEGGTWCWCWKRTKGMKKGAG